MGAALAAATVLELVRDAPVEVRRQVPPWMARHAKLGALLDVIVINCDEAHADRLALLEKLHDVEEHHAGP